MDVRIEGDSLILDYGAVQHRLPTSGISARLRLRARIDSQRSLLEKEKNPERRAQLEAFIGKMLSYKSQLNL